MSELRREVREARAQAAAAIIARDAARQHAKVMEEERDALRLQLPSAMHSDPTE